MAGLLQPEQVSAGAYHKGKGAFTLVIKVDHHSGRAVMIVKIHMADVDLLLLQGMTHVAAKRVTADAADKSAVAAKAGNPYRHVSRRACGTVASALHSPVAGPPLRRPEPKLLLSC